MSLSTRRLVGLGCMRLSTDPARDEQRALDTIRAGLDAGVTLLDTARSYGRDAQDAGHNERLIAVALSARAGEASSVTVVTKGGLVRDGSAWRPDGRARSLRASSEESALALDRLQLDVFLLHAPDPSTPLTTSARALARIERDGLARAVGLSNVTLAQLREALRHAPITVVEVALGAYHDAPFRDGLVRFCLDNDITVIAHTPLGGTGRAPALARRRDLPRRDDVSAAQLVLAWLYDLHPLVVPIPGARRPETARDAALAAEVRLTDEERRLLDATFPAAARSVRPAMRPVKPATARGEVVLIMGIQGAGKSHAVTAWVERGYERLNRDERGGSLRALARALDERLHAGAERIVLDNTYLTRASRNEFVEIARAHGSPARCIWIDTPLAEAQLNAIDRLLDRYDALPGPDELRSLSRRDPNTFAPTVQLRAARELEPPSEEEGFAAVERITSTRPRTGRHPGLVVALHAIEAARAGSTPVLVTGWSTDPPPVVDGATVALCPHGGGPPRCWCRPPLPGLVLAWARANDVDLTRTEIVGGGQAFKAMATTLGASWRPRSVG